MSQTKSKNLSVDDLILASTEHGDKNHWKPRGNAKPTLCGAQAFVGHKNIPFDFRRQGKSYFCERCAKIATDLARAEQWFRKNGYQQTVDDEPEPQVASVKRLATSPTFDPERHCGKTVESAITNRLMACRKPPVLNGFCLEHGVKSVTSGPVEARWHDKKTGLKVELRAYLDAEYTNENRLVFDVPGATGQGHLTVFLDEIELTSLLVVSSVERQPDEVG